MTFLDTNVILRYLTGDDSRKTPRCEQLFEHAQQGRTVLYLTHLVVAEVVWVLARYGHPRSRVAEAVKRLVNTPNIVVEEIEVILLALQWFERYAIDFIDAYNGAVMQARGLSAIYSYDTDFDTLPGLRRLEP